MTERATTPPTPSPCPTCAPRATTSGPACASTSFSCRPTPTGSPFWYPRALVPGTLEPPSGSRRKGTGTVYTYSVHFIGPSKAYKGDPPHIVALIDLDEGVRMMSNLVKDEEGYPSHRPG